MANKRQVKRSPAKKKGPTKAAKGGALAAGKRVDVEAAVRWYREKRPLYNSLAEKVAAIIEEVLQADGVEYHSVTSRAKDVGSFEKKADRYEDPATEIHDLAGIRAIAYVEAEARRIADVVRNLFEIDRGLSEDKSLDLGVDKVGYRSVHYVASLPPERCNLPEFRRFDGMRFEIQVRTILQHAWAEIEHDRNYKFTGVLPPEIQRSFALLAGMMEVADREFDRIAAEINEYAGRVVERTSAGELDIPVDTISLRQYLSEKFASAVESGVLLPTFGGADEGATELARELERFGVSTLAELDRLVPHGLEEALSRAFSADDPDNFLGLVRGVLVIANSERYMAVSWPVSRWTHVEASRQQVLREFGVDVSKLLQELHLRVEKWRESPDG